MSTKSNPTNVLALERQMAHEAEHRTRKYDKNGKRRPETLPPRHLKGARLLPPQPMFGHPF